MKRFLKTKFLPGAASMLVALSVPMSAMAAQIKDDLNVETVFGNLLDWLFLIFQLVGAGAIVFAIASFSMAVAQENPDQRFRALLFFAAGLLLVCIKYVLKAIGVIA